MWARIEDGRIAEVADSPPGAVLVEVDVEQMTKVLDGDGQHTGEWAPTGDPVRDERWVSAPTVEQLAAAGWQRVRDLGATFDPGVQELRTPTPTVVLADDGVPSARYEVADKEHATLVAAEQAAAEASLRAELAATDHQVLECLERGDSVPAGLAEQRRQVRAAAADARERAGKKRRRDFATGPITHGPVWPTDPQPSGR